MGPVRWLSSGPLHLVAELCLKVAKLNSISPGNGRGDGREALSQVPCRNSLLGVMQMWSKWCEPTVCHVPSLLTNSLLDTVPNL